MRELVNTGRRSGRTQTLLLTLIEEMDMHNSPVYLIVGQYGTGQLMMDFLRKYNVETKRVRIVALESLYAVQGADPRNVYIEHTAYEMANSNQLRILYLVEDAKEHKIWGRQ
jgi:hypothetical protein